MGDTFVRLLMLQSSFALVQASTQPIILREAPFNLSPPPCGHCPNSIYTPPPALKRALWGTFFQARFYHFTIFTIFLPFSLNKCPKPSGQGFRPPQNQANAHLNLENSSLKNSTSNHPDKHFSPLKSIKCPFELG